MISIREEEKRDSASVAEVTRKAFEASEFGHNGEAELIDQLRATEETVSLVGCLDDSVVGHLLFSPVTLRCERSQTIGMGLGPMSVLPEHQRHGIGAALVTAGLKQLFDEGCPFVVVLGHPDFYPRFGFDIASGHGIQHGFDGIPQNLFFICVNPSSRESFPKTGSAIYANAFGPQKHEG